VVVLVVLCCSEVSDFVITLFCYLNTISMCYSTVEFSRYLIISSNLIVLDVMLPPMKIGDLN
jgi:hypothetical protein